MTDDGMQAGDPAPDRMNSRVEDGTVLVLERVFPAPKAVAFGMFKDAEQLKRWWGPRGWEVPVCTVDFWPGGVWHYCMKCVDEGQGDFYGFESWGKGVYEQIDEPNSIVYTDYFSDAGGNVNEDLPATAVTLTFQDVGGSTKIVSRSGYASADALQSVLDMGMLKGITETWDRLEERLVQVQGRTG